ncbi:MAG: class I SAM-dependent methyltransferase [Spirochaetes bacterium]|nr:class I SAM-dependent methyltransferase [Spirochaetota bacterium]
MNESQKNNKENYWIQEERRYHNNKAKLYFNSSKLWEYFEYKYFYKFLYKKNVKSKEVLDFGCAGGVQLDKYFNYKKLQYKYNGCDISENLLKVAQKYKPDCKFTLLNGIDIPYEDKKYDIIFCLGVLHHVPDIKKYIFELYRILKPEGYLFIREPMWIPIGKGDSPFERGIPVKDMKQYLNELKPYDYKINLAIHGITRVYLFKIFENIFKKNEHVFKFFLFLFDKIFCILSFKFLWHFKIRPGVIFLRIHKK